MWNALQAKRQMLWRSSRVLSDAACLMTVLSGLVSSEVYLCWVGILSGFALCSRCAAASRPHAFAGGAFSVTHPPTLFCQSRSVYRSVLWRSFLMYGSRGGEAWGPPRVDTAGVLGVATVGYRGGSRAPGLALDRNGQVLGQRQVWPWMGVTWRCAKSHTLGAAFPQTKRTNQDVEGTV